MDKTLFLLGGGYSVREGIGKGLWQKIKDKADIWAINFCYKFMPYVPTTIIWMDEGFFGQCKRDLKMLECKKIANAHSSWETWKDVLTYRTSRNFKGSLVTRDNRVYVGGNGLTGFFALSLAVLNKYENIFLLGMDFGLVTDKLDKYNEHYTHWYQDEIKKMNWKSGGVGKPKVYRIEESKNKNKVNTTKMYVHNFGYYNQFHKKIFNISPNSHIKAFPKITYEQFFEKIKES